MKTTRILFAMALVLSVAFQAEAKKVKLQYQLKSGDEFKYEMSVSQDIAQEVNGQSMSTSVATSMTYGFKVTGVSPAGDFLMSAALVGYSMSTTSPMGEMKYNSVTDTVVPEFAKSSAILLNQYYSFTLSPLGKITDVKAPEGLVEKVNKSLESIAGQNQMTASSASIAATPEGFQKTVEGMIITFPDGGAEMKKPWEEKSKLNQMVSLNVAAKYELVNSTKDTNELKVTAQITQDPGAAPMEMQGMNMTFELRGAKEGTIILDANTGLMTTVNSTTSISGTISIDSPQLPSPMSIPMTIRSVEKVTKK